MNNIAVNIFAKILELTPNKIREQYFDNIVPIFMLHRIDDKFQISSYSYSHHITECLEYIRKYKYNPISLQEYITSVANGEKIKPKSVIFTVDDGFYDQYDIGGTLFGNYDIPLTCFVISDFIDGVLWPWDDQLIYILSNTKLKYLDIKLPNQSRYSINLNESEESVYKSMRHLRNLLKGMNQSDIYAWIENLYTALDVEQLTEAPFDFRPMSWNDAQKFIDNGHHIAPHTKTHRILSQLSDKEAYHEITESVTRVKKMLNGSSDVFAYPTGRTIDYGEREISLLKKLDIHCAVNTVPGHIHKKTDLYNLPRFTLPRTKFNFIQYLTFFEELKHRILS